MSQKQQNYLFPLIIVFIVCFLIGFITTMNNSMIEFCKDAFHLTDTQGQLVNTFFYGAYFFSIPFAMMMSKIGYKATLVLGLTVVGMGFIANNLGVTAALGSSSVYTVFLCCMSIVALGVVMLQLVANPYVMVLGKPESGAFRMTSGACEAFLGKAQIFNEDWAGAKTSLKNVIDSGNYALAPTSDLLNMFHKVGDGNCEKVLEMNYVYKDGLSGVKYHFQRNQALFFRNIKEYPTVLIQAGDGWGNNVSPTQKFMDAIMKHEPNSARRKAWFASYEEWLTEYPYALKAGTVDVPDETGKKSKVSYKADADMTKDEKLMDYRRGLNCEKYDETYANYGYYFMSSFPGIPT